MVDSIRQQILDNVDTRFKAVTAFGDNVFQWRTTELSQDELPALCYRDIAEESQNSNFGYHDSWLTIECIISVADSTSAETARNLIADILTAIGSDQTWGGLAILTEPSSNEMILKEDSNIIAGIQIIFKIQFRTRSFDPCSQ